MGMTHGSASTEVHLRNGVVGDWQLDDAAFLESFRLPTSADKVEALALANPLARDGQVELLEEDHHYVVTNPDRSRVRVPASVTGLLSQFHEEFDADAAINLMRKGPSWAAKRRQYLRADGSEMSAEEIKTAWALNGEISRKRGVLMHFHIEQHLNGVCVDEPRSPEFLQFLDFELEVLRERGLRPWRSELSIFHCGLRLAGQCDLLCLDADGRVVVVDWKRSKDVARSCRFRRMLLPLVGLDDCNYNHYALQLNLYRYVLETEYSVDVSGMLLGAFHPSHETYRCIEVPPMPGELDLLLAHLRGLGAAGEPEPGPSAVFPGVPEDEEGAPGDP
mmetsp:Transcript_18331/g.57669  ORF Transcript_18331/g.57669 Transcript_18331/m.57669 type:complete len:334 (+) Transcript_18331:80-1081(+)